MYHFLGKQGEGREDEISHTAGCTASRLPLALLALTEQTTDVSAPISPNLLTQEKNLWINLLNSCECIQRGHF